MTERTSWTTGAFAAHAPRGAAVDETAGLLLVASRAAASVPRVVPLTAASLVVGRERDAGLHVPETSVSRAHARFDRAGHGRFVVTDLGSTNGTYVDGVRVESHLLSHGELVRVGDTVFVFTAREALAHASVAPSLDDPDGLVGGLSIARVREVVRRVAPTQLTVLALGESGTGKELVARAIHRLSGRTGAFVAVNCGALPSQLVESELFGHRRGAFTSADRDRDGWVKAAHGGTLFLDEIGDLPLEAQGKLLRLLEEREITPVGAHRAIPVDVRFVAATHRDLPGLVRDGKFRGDLLARLAQVELHLPPLRARREDLLPLLTTFLARSGAAGRAAEAGFLLALAQHDFPYNVRELESAVRYAVAMAGAGPLVLEHLPRTVQDALSAAPSVRASTGTPVDGRSTGAAIAPVATAEGRGPDEATLRGLLQRHAGNVAAVGRELGKERMQIHRWMKRFGIDPDAYRA